MDRREFLGSALIAAAGGALATTAGTVPAFAASSKQILQAQGLEIVEGGKAVRLRGFNLGGWMLIEDYMIGLPWTEWTIRDRFRRIVGEPGYNAFFDAYAASFIAEADIAFIARQGFNFVRLPVNYRHFESDLAPGVWIEAGFQQLHAIVEACRKHHIWVMLDMHAVPGAQARDQNAGSAYGEVYFWKHIEFMQRATALWKELARRYSGDATIAAYNLLCEPVTEDVALLNRWYLDTIAAIRQVDREHIIALDPNLWARDINSLHDELFVDPQVIPVLHHYYSDDEAFAAITEYPASYKGKLCDRAALAKTMDGKFDQKRIARPTLAAEFGVEKSMPQPFAVQLAITRELVSIFEERGWGWSMWCYKDLKDMGIVNPKKDTPWRRFLDSEQITKLMDRYHALEKPFIEGVHTLMAETDIDGDVKYQFANEVSRDFDVPALDFILRRLKGRSTAELAAMAQSFAFENCEVRQDQLGTLRPFLRG